MPPTDQELKATLPMLFNIAVQCTAYARTFSKFYPTAAIDGSEVHPEAAERITLNAVIDGTLMYIRKTTEFFLPRSSNHKEDSLYSYLYPGYSGQCWIIPREEYVIFHKRVGHLTLEEVRNGRVAWDALAYSPIAMRKWAEFFDAMASVYATDPETFQYCEQCATVISADADRIEAQGILSRIKSGEIQAPATTSAPPPPPAAPITDLMKFKDVLETHFGAGTSTVNVNSTGTNHVIGALNHEQFGRFRAAFAKRLERLAVCYPATSPHRKELLNRLNEIGSAKNWHGAYAEAVALDFFNSDENYLPEMVGLAKKGSATDTLAGAFGGHQSDHDGYYKEWDIAFDVKVLSDKAKALLDGIITDATKGLKDVPHIMPEYPLDDDFEKFADQRSKILAELKAALAAGARPTALRSSVLPDLTFKIMWGGGIQMTTSAYNAHAHAENHHTLLFKHAKKFSCISPNLIVFVVFSWFSEKGLNVFEDKTFYRSFARRFFCQYKNDTRRADAVPFLPGFKGPELVSQITSKLSGVIFIEDIAIEAKNPDAINARAFAYLNPNAEHSVSRYFRHHLEELDVPIEDFAHDNY